jgi:hypothetical protein
MKKIKEVWKELNGQPTDRTDRIIAIWFMICWSLLILAAIFDW